MRYVSTRGQMEPLPFQDAVIMGLAPDGGLLVPDRIPDAGAHLERWRALTFPELAAQIVSLYVDDIPAEELDALARRSYAGFDHPEVTPVVPVGDLCVLELFHGPTLAFKDVALQLLGNLFEYILERRGEWLTILGATSGDTGSAAIAGVRGKRNMQIFVMFPRGRTSRVQELQMTTVADANVHALALEGSFDDCQEILKEAFRDLDFKQRHRLAAVNSVNWARVLAQIVYYFYAYFRARPAEEHGEPVTFSVPTGNFGDIFAGFLAARMGLPVDRLVLASNANDILPVFFETGRYRRGAVRHTRSPSMDIQVASNFERFLYYQLEEDASRLRRHMAQFVETGALQLDPAELDPLIRACAVSEEETLGTIRDVYAAHGYVLDPHTAVGVAAGRALRTPAPLVCLATAHPAKFPEAVREATGRDLAHHPRVDRLFELPTRCESLPAERDVIKAFIHANVMRAR